MDASVDFCALSSLSSLLGLVSMTASHSYRCLRILIVSVFVIGSLIVGGVSLLSSSSDCRRCWRRRRLVVVVGGGVAEFSENLILY